MPGVAVIELVLEIDAASDPVTGTVCERGSSAQSFTGWTQLGHVLDMAIRTARDQAAVTQAEDCSTP